MKIEGLTLEQNNHVATAAARVIWEDCGRPSQQIFFATPVEFGSYLDCNPNAFLLAAILPAMRHGERRIKVDGDVCPELAEGILTAAAWFRAWYGLEPSATAIEAGVLSRPAHVEVRDSASFLSGGVDSLAMLRANRLTYPGTYPRSIRHCFSVYGFGLGQTPATYDEHRQAFDRIATSLAGLACEAGATFIPVYTNARHLCSELRFWGGQFHGAALAAVAHSFTRLVGAVSIAASDNAGNMAPWGSHPLIDPNYSSADLRVFHDGVRYSRLEKTRLIAEWPAALRSIHVCAWPDRVLNAPPGVLNCGECEKCIRTMTAMVAAGALERCPAFPRDDVSPERLKTVALVEESTATYYREMMGPLGSRGRDDLVDAIRWMIFREKIRWGMKGLVKNVVPSRLLRRANGS